MALESLDFWAGEVSWVSGAGDGGVAVAIVIDVVVSGLLVC